MATPAAGVAGGQSSVRAYEGPFTRPYKGDRVGIEFTTKQPPDNFRRWFGMDGWEWYMEEGQYLDIEIKNVIHPDGTLEPYQGPPKPKPQFVLAPGTERPQPQFKPAPGGKPPVVPGTLRPDPAPPQPPGRKFTMKEWMVADALDGDWQAVSGIYLRTGIWDTELAPILEMLVSEGYAEKSPDTYRQGWFLYRASPQWLQFKTK